MKKKLLSTLFFAVLICNICIGQKFKNYHNYNHPLPHLIDSLKVNISDLYILVDKSDYKLTLQTNNQTIKEYPVVFGGNPTDDKLREGDQCTPEGKFTVRTKYPHKSWSKFIWFDYPTMESWEKHKQAKAEGKISKNAKIGGALGIHGVPKGYDYAIDYKMNWTLGCVSLKNKDINELYLFVKKGMSVIICNAKIRKENWEPQRGFFDSASLSTFGGHKVFTTEDRKERREKAK